MNESDKIEVMLDYVKSYLALCEGKMYAPKYEYTDMCILDVLAALAEIVARAQQSAMDSRCRDRG